MRGKFLFITILILTVFLRTFRLDFLPPSLNWDEVSLGYNAYSILKTGHDEWGQFLPLSFRAFGDYKLPGYIYLEIPFIAVLGLNSWSVRLLSVFSGTGVVLLIFFMLKQITSDKKIAYWGMFLASAAPWPLILSRIALEANLALFFVTAGVFLTILWLRKKQPTFLISSAVLFGLSIFTYNSCRITVPLLILLMAVIFLKEFKRRWKISILALIIFSTFLTVATPLALLQDSSARYRWTAILDSGAVAQIDELRGRSTYPEAIKKLIYNRPNYFLSHAFINYISHFDPNFLFIKGGSNYQFSIPGSGLLYLIYLPFLLIGLWRIFKFREKEEKRFGFIILGWLLLAPVPAAITRDSPHSLRSILMIPPLLQVTAVGVGLILNTIKVDLLKKIISLLLLATVLISLFIFWQNYQGNYIKNYSWSWQYGYRQAADFISKNYSAYDKIYISKKYGEPHEFLLFYLNYNPQKYQSDSNLIRYQRSDWFWVDRFGRFYFINDWEIKERAVCAGGERCLLITSPGNFPKNFSLIETVNFKDGQPAFMIGKI